MKILLLQPIVPKKVLWGEYEKGEGFVPPIGLISIASYLRKKGFDISILDSQVERTTEEELRKLLRDNNFDTIGIPTFTNSISYSYETAKICKEVLPKVKIIFGGPHVSALPERTMMECDYIDFIVVGEGEYRMEKLLNYFKYQSNNLDNIDGLCYKKDGKILLNKMSCETVNLDDIPLPAYDLIKMEKYIPHPTQYKSLPNYPVLIQRGCPYNCAFCAAHAVHGRTVRFKKVETVIDELKMLKEKYNAKGVYFQDSTFLIKRKYIVELLNRMIEENLDLQWACNTRVNTVDDEILKLMKKAGCWMVVYGIESANQKTLNLMRKGVTVEQNEKAVKMTEKNKMLACCSYILCMPGETYEDSMNTIKFALKLKARMSMFYLPVPYPGTELIEICKKDGGYNKDAKWEDYSAADFSRPVYVNPLIGKEKMQYLLNYAFKKYYTNPGVIFKNLISIRNFTDIKKYLIAFRALFNI